MSTEVHSFDGTVKWLRREPALFRDPNTGLEKETYAFSFYPVDNAVRKAMAATGIKNKLKEDDLGFFYTLRAAEPFPIEGVADDSLIGNGSAATVDLLVESFVSRKYGKVVRSKVTHVSVTNLIEFIPTPQGLPA